jgi:hypothetical protein
MTRSEIQTRINTLREELENRFKYGAIKLANSDGTPIPSVKLQAELYSLIYKMSRIG